MAKRKPPGPKLQAEFRKNRIRRVFLIREAEEEDRKARDAKTAKTAMIHAENAIDLRADAQRLRVRRRAQKGGSARRRRSGGGLFA